MTCFPLAGGSYLLMSWIISVYKYESEHHSSPLGNQSTTVFFYNFNQQLNPRLEWTFQICCWIISNLEHHSMLVARCFHICSMRTLEYTIHNCTRFKFKLQTASIYFSYWCLEFWFHCVRDCGMDLFFFPNSVYTKPKF